MAPKVARESSMKQSVISSSSGHLDSTAVPKPMYNDAIAYAIHWCALNRHRKRRSYRLIKWEMVNPITGNVQISDSSVWIDSQTGPRVEKRHWPWKLLISNWNQWMHFVVFLIFDQRLNFVGSPQLALHKKNPLELENERRTKGRWPRRSQRRIWTKESKSCVSPIAVTECWNRCMARLPFSISKST